jgi:EmrB/QacA subfamily drug resistance transporter
MTDRLVEDPDLPVTPEVVQGGPEPPVRRRGRLTQPTTAVAVAYVTGIFMTAMDMHIVNVALPTLQRDFDAPLSAVQWTVTAYLLSLAILIPASGWIGDRIGTKRTFLFALATFTLASALCGLAGNLGELIGARVLQGVGGGMLTPSGTAMLYRAYPPEKRAKVTRTLIIPILLAPGTAPILGGVLTQELSWRWVFFVNLPVGVITLVFAARYLVEDRPAPSGRLDIRGLLLSGVGLASLLYAVSEGAVEGWGSPQIVITAVVGVTAIWAFAAITLRQSDPLLRLRLLHDRLFRATNIVIALASGAFLGSLYLAPIFLQEVLHQSPIGSGTTTFLEAVGVCAASQTVGRLYPRLGPRVMAGVGGVCMAVSLSAFVLIDSHTSLWLIRLLMFIIGACNSATFLSVQASMFTTISRADTGHASAIYNSQRQAAIAISIALLTTIVSSVGSPLLTAFHAAFLAAAGMALLGAVCAVTLISTEDARATMTARRP